MSWCKKSAATRQHSIVDWKTLTPIAELRGEFGEDNHDDRDARGAQHVGPGCGVPDEPCAWLIRQPLGHMSDYIEAGAS